MKLLVLRPQPGAGETARRARALGFDVRLYPLFTVEPRDWIGPAPESVDALLLTSANTLRHGGAQIARYRHLPAFVIGNATAAAAREAGFCDIIRGAAFVDMLLHEIVAQGYRRILHPSGEKTVPYGPVDLQIARIPVYRATKIGDPGALAACVEPGMIALVHSPRAGRRLAHLAPPPCRAQLHIVAISPAALDACHGGWASAQAAPTPDDDAMLALALSLCKEAGADGRDAPAP